MTMDDASTGQLNIPLAEERISFGKKTVETGRVQVSTRIEERCETVSDMLRHEDVVVERIPIGRIVDAPPAPRQDGDTWIVPIFEETLVLEKRFLLKEEVHVIRTSRLEPFEQDVTLRAMHADVQRTTTPNPQD